VRAFSQADKPRSKLAKNDHQLINPGQFLCDSRPIFLAFLHKKPSLQWVVGEIMTFLEFSIYLSGAKNGAIWRRF